MANLVICCDGTWNTPDNKDGDLPAPTNVYKFYKSLAKADADGTPQKKFYRAGVGTTGKWIERFQGGGFGDGIRHDIESGYKALADRYEPGDKVYLIGFSRGAFAARSLSGLITRCHLPAFANSDIPEGKRWDIIHRAFELYQNPESQVPLSGVPLHENPPIEFLGVWDTVGALGVPEEFRWLWGKEDRTKYRFYDTKLSKNVRIARQALAIDERRQIFEPTLWTEYAAGQDVEQIWFPGVHADVGGGYSDCRLGNITLDWMIGESQKRGLAFEKGFLEQITGDEQGLVHESVTSVFRRMRLRPRAVPNFNDPQHARTVHGAARNRQEFPPLAQPEYWDTRAIAPNTPMDVRVHARKRWCPTGLFLKKGVTYSFAAQGQWKDKNIECGPEGNASNFAHFSAPIAVFIELLETRERWIQRKLPTVDYPITRRHNDMPWFALVGCIANGGGANSPSQEVHQHESFLIGTGCTHTPKQDGFLYCYPNDAWHHYRNNAGSMDLTITLTG
ncbi:DUF2235 domain-containing protein [Roseobacter sp. N2S]|uniref:DUF2235 domain-containing protein n=1 Tax=Roseobacter sp. N2S TaxID=2663844 RepID=UPI0028570EA8|nr:DUF2235 domain-containing protein [Roseobacter sp. N2S]MDR6263922.1 hypothetical protein [Roseobacter sp. N2S]